MEPRATEGSTARASTSDASATRVTAANTDACVASGATNASPRLGRSPLKTSATPLAMTRCASDFPGESGLSAASDPGPGPGPDPDPRPGSPPSSPPSSRICAVSASTAARSSRRKSASGRTSRGSFASSQSVDCIDRRIIRLNRPPVAATYADANADDGAPRIEPNTSPRRTNLRFHRRPRPCRGSESPRRARRARRRPSRETRRASRARVIEPASTTRTTIPSPPRQRRRSRRDVFAFVRAS